MAQLSNDSTGRGFTHVSRIDLDSFNEISGNATQTLTLFTGDNAMLRSALILVPDNILADGVIQAQVGDTGATDEFIAETQISGLGAPGPGIVATANYTGTSAVNTLTLEDYSRPFSNPAFAIDTNFDVLNASAIDFSVDGYLHTLAANTNFDTLAVREIAADLWGVAALSVDADGTTYVDWGTYDYATEQQAKGVGASELIAISGECRCGFVTVLTGSGVTWTAGTDALEGGTGGNPATTTNYYSWSGSDRSLTTDLHAIYAALPLVTNGKEIDTSVTCSLALSTGDWSSNNGAEFFVLLDIATPELLAK